MLFGSLQTQGIDGDPIGAGEKPKFAAILILSVQESDFFYRLPIISVFSEYVI